MSCPNATSPIDINMNDVYGKCDLKCDYSFKYQQSACSATNRGDYISLSYDNSSTPPVIYNSNKYEVREVRIYTPSLHSYSNSKADAELIIIHNSTSGSKPLLVCIPINKSNSTSTSSQLFNAVISGVSTSAPVDDETASINFKNYNLSLIVPKKPYFSYSASEPYQPCMTPVDFVVFDPLNASLDINTEALNTLQKVIQKNMYDVKKGVNLFYNDKGPSRYGSSGSDEIYIDCQPVGSSIETEAVIQDYSSGSSEFNFKDFLNNPITQLILGSLLFIAILVIVSQIFGFIKPSKGGDIGNTILRGGFKKNFR